METYIHALQVFVILILILKTVVCEVPLSEGHSGKGMKRITKWFDTTNLCALSPPLTLIGNQSVSASGRHVLVPVALMKTIVHTNYKRANAPTDSTPIAQNGMPRAQP